MTPRIHCITLPVDDLTRAIAFYRDWMGLPMEGPEESDEHFAFELPGGLYLVLILRPDFARFTGLAAQRVAERGASECILSYFAGSREEVDVVLNRAAVGGAAVTRASDSVWGYAGYLTDPDGHLWEVTWNPTVTDGA